MPAYGGNDAEEQAQWPQHEMKRGEAIPVSFEPMHQESGATRLTHGGSMTAPAPGLL
jgi:hypothetical protein